MPNDVEGKEQKQREQKTKQDKNITSNNQDL